MRRWLPMLRTPLGAAAALALVVLLALVLVGPAVWGDAATRVDTAALRQGSTARHLLGTDGLGRDVLARVIVATRLSLGLALAATLLAVAVGLLFGILPVVLGRRAGRLVTAAVNLAVAFPGLLLALALAVIFGAGAKGAVLAVGLAGAPGFSRLTNTLAASMAGRDFVAAARVVGVGRLRLLARHILPNIAEPLIVNATLGAGAALLAFAGLSFLGLGVQPPAYDWGRLLDEGLNRIFVSPAAALAPGVAVVLAGLAFNLFGELAAQVVGLRSAVSSHGGGRPSRAAPPAPAPALVDLGPTGAVLRVADLWVSFPDRDGWTDPVAGISFEVAAGELVGMVGESGSGKSLTALAVAGLVDPPGAVRAGRLEFVGTDLTRSWNGERRLLLGTSLAMVFQGPLHLPEPGAAGRSPAQRGRRGAPAAAAPGGSGARGRAAARGPDRRRAQADPAVPARALRRNATAGDDRHGADGPAPPHHRGRAHHGTGRHRAAADPRIAARGERELRRRGAVHLP